MENEAHKVKTNGLWHDHVVLKGEIWHPKKQEKVHFTKLDQEYFPEHLAVQLA